MINTGPESSFDGTNNGETSMHTSQVRPKQRYVASGIPAGFNAECSRKQSILVSFVAVPGSMVCLWGNYLPNKQTYTVCMFFG
jgi:hypothetical protein